jgi:hypothetical protein
MSKTLEAVLPSTMAFGGLDDLVAQWREADQHFREALDALLTDHDYAVLREAVEGTCRIPVSAAWPVRSPTLLASSDAGGVFQVGTPLPTLGPLLMRHDDYVRDVKAPLEADNWEIVEPDQVGVYTWERRGYQLVYKEHQGLSRQVVYGGTAAHPSNVPMRRKRIAEDTKRLLRTAYRNAESGSEYCVPCVMTSNGPSIILDDGTSLVTHKARDALQEAQNYGLLIHRGVERDLYCLTELGKATARDYSERGQ